MSSSKEDTSQNPGNTPTITTSPRKTNALYISEIYGSSSQGGILTLSGMGPEEPGGNINMNPLGGKMGIGTDNPTNSLSVVGDSDFTGKLTIKGNSQIEGDLSITGELDLSSIKNSFWVNDQPIYLRTESTTDKNHGIGYNYGGTNNNNPDVDGPVVFGYLEGALSINKGGQVKHILKWDYPGNDFTGTASVIIDGHLGFTGNGEFSGDLKIDGNVGIGMEPDKNFQLSVKGNSQIEGDLSITGELDLSSIKNSFWVNDQPIYLRTESTTDKNHGIGYNYGGTNNNNPDVDGPVVFGYAGGALSTTINKLQHILKWDSNGVYFQGTGGRTRIARLSVGSDGTISSNNVFSNQYLYYELIFNNVAPAVKSQQLRAQFCTPENFLAEKYCVCIQALDGSPYQTRYTNQDYMPLWHGSCDGLDANTGIFGTMKIFNPYGTGFNRCFTADLYAPMAYGDNGYQNLASGHYADQKTLITGISIFFGDCKVASGTIDVYGWN